MKISKLFFKSKTNETKGEEKITSKENNKIKGVSKNIKEIKVEKSSTEDLNKKLLESKKKTLLELKNEAIKSKEEIKQIECINSIRKTILMQDTPPEASRLAIDYLKEIAEKTIEGREYEKNYAMGILNILVNELEENKGLSNYASRTINDIKITVEQKIQKKILEKKLNHATNVLNSFKEAFIEGKDNNNLELLKSSADAMMQMVFNKEHPIEVNNLAIKFIKQTVLETADFHLFETLLLIQQKANIAFEYDNNDLTMKEILFQAQSALKEINFKIPCGDLALDAIGNYNEEKGLKYLQERAINGNMDAVQMLVTLLTQKKNKDYDIILDLLKETAVRAYQNDHSDIVKFIEIYLSSIKLELPDKAKEKVQKILHFISSNENNFYIDSKGSVLLAPQIRLLTKDDAKKIKYEKLGKYQLKKEDAVVVKERDRKYGSKRIYC